MSMTSVFDNITRIGEDTCGLSQSNVQNTHAIDYRLQNYFLKDCDMSNPIHFATSQPNVNYTGMAGVGSGVGAGGCVVQQSSDLLIGSIQTNPKCRLNLQQRPFLTVPFLGRGKGNPTVESGLQQGTMNENKKSVNPSSETSHLKYSNYPLIEPLANSVTNTQYLVEQDAAKGWIRGGVPSRDLTREKQYNSAESEFVYA